jgi:neurotransmitter:Na+ symporter, NSS family
VEDRESIHGEWSGRLAFILAATGSAVGLGNIWKFPYVTGENGGGAFVLLYLLCITFIGIPVLMAEILIGRRGRQTPHRSIEALARESGGAGVWSWFGLMGVLCSFLLLSFYVVFSGWAVAYVLFAATGQFSGKTADEVGAMFGGFTSDWKVLLTWSTLFTVCTIIVVARGVKRGLEKAVMFMMPGLGGILLILVGYALSQGEFMHGFTFLFQPDFSELSTDSAVVALGHAFFTLSLASGTMIAYGAYLPRRVSIARTSLIIAATDTGVALVAGMAIFPIVFQYGLSPGQGPGLIFVTLPIAFGQMPMGTLFGGLFFVMLSFAAFTSAISLLEPSTALVIEKFSLPRAKAAMMVGACVWLASLPHVLSFNLWDFATPLGDGYRGVFGIVDYLTANILLPVGGLLIALFVGWKIKGQFSRSELEDVTDGHFRFWQVTLRFVAPILIVVVFLNGLGWLKFRVAEPAADPPPVEQSLEGAAETASNPG